MWYWFAIAAAIPAGFLAFFGFQTARYLWWYRRSERNVAFALTEIVWRVAGEIIAYVTLGWWKLVEPLNRSHAPTGRPVLCIHGFTQDPTNFRGVRKALAAEGRPAMAVFLGFPGRSLTGYVPALIGAMEALRDRSPDGFDVVAHSMGGVVLRLALAARPDLSATIHKIVTLGSPHGGTAGARGMFGLIGEGRDMRPDSPVVRDLPDLSITAPTTRLFTVAADLDLIVYPAEYCHLPTATHVDLPVGHAGLLTDPRAIAKIVELLTGPTPKTV